MTDTPTSTFEDLKGLPEGPWDSWFDDINKHWYVAARGFVVEPLIASEISSEAIARAIASLPSMGKEIERLRAALDDTLKVNRLEALKEVIRLRSLNAELVEALEIAHGVLVSLIKPNPSESARHVFAHAVEAEAEARAALTKAKGDTSP